MEDNDDPRRSLIAFVSGLPKTIQTELLTFIIIYAIRLSPPEDLSSYEKIVIDFLSDREPLRLIGAVICTVAVIDHILNNFVARLDSMEDGLQEVANQHPELPRTALLSFPLRRRHWVQALNDWRALKATKLTPQTLQYFEDNLIVQRYGQ